MKIFNITVSLSFYMLLIMWVGWAKGQVHIPQWWTWNSAWNSNQPIPCFWVMAVSLKCLYPNIFKTVKLTNEQLCPTFGGENTDKNENEVKWLVEFLALHGFGTQGNAGQSGSDGMLLEGTWDTWALTGWQTLHFIFLF